MNAMPLQPSGKLFLNIIWHQHQPMYLDPELDQLQGPWVRTHGTKDYYDMGAILENYPEIHCNINLTSSLLLQLEQYYVERLGPFIDVKKNHVDAEKFLAQWKGKTDPWIDLALRPTKDFSDQDLNSLLHNPWNALYITDVMLSRFPQYKALKEKHERKERLSEQELREIKFWFFLAYFDPDFLEKEVLLADGAIVNLQDIVTKNSDGTYTIARNVTEEDCNRIVAETYKVLANIIPIHRKLLYHPKSYIGQVEIATTPFYHPILPLLYDSDLAKICQPHDAMPPRFSFPEDAYSQVSMSVEFYDKIFGMKPNGMWPAEGSVAQEIVPLFASNGLIWIAADEKVLHQSRPGNQANYYPYRLDARENKTASIAIVFRDTVLSDKIGFVYQHYRGEDAANDFINNILQSRPPADEPDRLLTVILDGENAWEWYRYDNDGKEFLHALYRKLSSLHEAGEVTTVTMSEYIVGNPKRNVPAHPISTMRKLEWLYPGSWINANYDTWIGKPEKNRAWEYLLTARQDLEKSGLAKPDPKAAAPQHGTKSWYRFKAWDEMYAAEGSDWFWWYGTQQNVPGGTAPFDKAYITHLNNIYKYAKLAGGEMPDRRFEPIMSQNLQQEKKEQGAMVRQS
jgi:alpha-amylase/alpha-mannosidase (GH57 family)